MPVHAHPAFTATVASLATQLRDTELRIDVALDAGRRRDFAVWCKRRRSLSSRLQSMLLNAASGSQVGR